MRDIRGRLAEVQFDLDGEMRAAFDTSQPGGEGEPAPTDETLAVS